MSVAPAVLSQSVSLDGLPEDLAIDLIKVARTRPVKSGVTLFEAGDPGDGFYTLLEGSLRVILRGEEGEQVLAILSPGAIFGEMAYLNAAPRTADVIATEPSELLILTQDTMQKAMDRMPAVAARILHNLSLILVERLHETTTRYVKSSNQQAAA